MEPINKGEFVKFANGESYYAIDTIIYNNKKYIYFAKQEGGVVAFLGKELIDNGELVIDVVEDKEEVKKVMSLFVEKNNWK